MKRNICFLTAALFCAFLFVQPAIAADEKMGVSVYGQYIPFLSGSAGSGSDAPDYSDAFDGGIGGGVEASYKVCPRFSFLGGVGYETYSGQKYKGVTFESLDIIPVYVGGKLHLMEDSKLDPYLRVDAGLAHVGKAYVKYAGSKSKYWNESWEFFGDFGGGVEYRVNSIGFFAEIKVRYMGAPSPAMGYASEP
ncbi:MAG: porin family protein, partial [Desulfobacterales bacterium]|nr:porin family protein [Desulfobacterales bacterium]